MLAELAKHPALKRYRDVRPVGRGAFGVVFRGRDPEDGRDVAIKILLLGQNEEVLKRFRREARALRGIDSPFLVRLRGYDLDVRPPVLVMEWIDGGGLHLAAKRRRPPEPALVRGVARDLLRGAAALHEAGLVHRDIKPANVFLRADGRAVLGDLGMVGGEEASTISRTGVSLGTPRYMPPEVLVGRRWSPAGDLFAAGITLWEYACGVHPNVYFDHSLMLFADPDVRLPTIEAAGAYRNPSLQVLIDALLAFDPAARPGDLAMALALLGPEAEAARLDEAARASWEPPTRPEPKDAEDEARTYRPAEPRSAHGRSAGGTGGPGSADPARTRAPLVGRTTRQAPAPRGPVAARAPAISARPAAATGPPRASLAPRLAAAAALGGLLVAGGAWVSRRGRPDPGEVAAGPGPGVGAGEARAFPAAFTPAPPDFRYLEGGRIELRWESPVPAFARGSARAAGGILELPRGPSTRPIRLVLPAPARGEPYRDLGFVFEDREGGLRRQELDPGFVLRPVAEFAEGLLAARGEPAARSQARYRPIRALHTGGGLRAIDPALHQRLDEWTAAWGGG